MNLYAWGPGTFLCLGPEVTYMSGRQFSYNMKMGASKMAPWVFTSSIGPSLECGIDLAMRF